MPDNGAGGGNNDLEEGVMFYVNPSGFADGILYVEATKTAVLYHKANGEAIKPTWRMDAFEDIARRRCQQGEWKEFTNRKRAIAAATKYRNAQAAS